MQKPKILFIDDSEEILIFLEKVLAGLDIEKISARNGEEALDKLNSEAFFLVLVDLELPDFDGIEILKRHHSSRDVKTPFIFLTGSEKQEHLNAAYEAGAIDFLLKPINPKVVRKKVEIFLNLYENQAQIQNQLRKIANENLKRLHAEKELFEKERLLMQQIKQNQMGETLSLIAHHWRQPLSAITTISGTLSMKLKTGMFNEEKFLIALDDIDLKARDLSETITQFQNFFKPKSKKEVFFLKKEILKIHRLVKARLEQLYCRFEINVSEESKICNYKSHLLQVLINLINNSIDAFQKKGIPNPLIVISEEIFDEFELIHIKDNAGGVNQDILEKIFEPYFSTKENKNNTGLGLYQAKTLTEKYLGGEIRCSNEGDGAKFTLLLSRET